MMTIPKHLGLVASPYCDHAHDGSDSIEDKGEDSFCGVRGRCLW